MRQIHEALKESIRCPRLTPDGSCRLRFLSRSQNVHRFDRSQRCLNYYHWWFSQYDGSSSSTQILRINSSWSQIWLFPSWHFRDCSAVSRTEGSGPWSEVLRPHSKMRRWGNPSKTWSYSHYKLFPLAARPAQANHHWTAIHPHHFRYRHQT